MDSYVTLRNLTEHREIDLNATFTRMAEFLEKSGEHARVQFRILKDARRLFWCLELDKDACKVNTNKTDQPGLEIVTRAETWWQIAQGSLSPLEAFLQGKMRIRGDVELGKRLMKQLASSEGRLDIC